MNRPDRVSVSLGRTVNLGNFESVRIEVGFDTALAPGETPADAIKRALSECDAPVQRRVKRIEAKLAARDNED